ncbi:MAG TPA: hypothetical protein VL492_04445 [Methylovirgula sp.]|nr:hypothetical protein [Methylovirgula sp.]
MARIVLLVLIFFTGVSTLHAGSREESYLAERDALIEKFTAIEKAGKVSDRTDADITTALADLQKALEGLVGRDHIAGLAAAPKIHLDTLFKTDEGYGMLDGLDYASSDGRTVVTITTTALFRHWLTEHENWWGKGDMPASLNAAVRSEAFFTQAISTDAAVVTYGEIPIAKPAESVTVVVLLAATTQDESPRLPDKIVVSIIGKDRAFVAVAPLGAKIEALPACTAIWDAAKKKIDAHETTSDPKAANLGEEANEIREVADQAYRRCFAEKAKTASFFAAVTREAQHFIDSLPKR